MPAKKAATEAAPKSSAKPEKPVEQNKKQAGGQKDAGAPAKGGPQKAQPGTQAGAPAAAQFALSTDPGEAAIQRKLNDIDAKINKYKGDLDQIKKDLEAENRVGGGYQTERKNLRNKLDEGYNATKNISSERSANIDKLKECQRVRSIKYEEANKIKDKLPNKPSLSLGQEAYLKELDDMIRALENGLASSAFPLAQEKRKVEEISQLRQSKKIYKDYVAVLDKIALDNKNINDLKAELEKTKGTFGETQAERQGIRDTINQLTTKIDESNKKADSIAAKREPIRDDIKKLQEAREQENRNLYLYRGKKRDEEKLRREKERERMQLVRQEKERQYQERVAERTKQEQLKIPLDDEIYFCRSLAKYLEGLLPPKQKEDTAATTAEVPAGGVILKKDDEDNKFTGKEKKGKKQKAVKVAQDLKHNVEVFLQFETISLTAPSKLVDVEASIAELKAKEDYYTKLQATKIEERKAEAAAAAAAAESKAKEAAPSSPSAAPAASASTETTTSPASSPKPLASDEAVAAE